MKIPILRIIEYLVHNDEIYYSKKFNRKPLLKYQKDILTGGSNIYIYNYKNEDFTFVYTDDDLFILGNENNDECITLAIDKEKTVININNITADQNIKCFFKQVTEKKGTFLLELAIKFAISLSKKIPSLKKISLTDNSMLYCDDIIKSVPFSDIRQIISGDTFYGKFGFIPINKQDIDSYNKNKKVLTKLIIGDINFNKYLSKFNKKDDNILNFINENKTMKINELFNILSNKNNFQENCELIDYLIKKIYKHYNLVSMYHINYEINL